MSGGNGFFPIQLYKLNANLVTMEDKWMIKKILLNILVYVTSVCYDDDKCEQSLVTYWIAYSSNFGL